MAGNTSHEPDDRQQGADRSSGVSRRNFVQAVGASGAAAGLAGCMGGSESNNGNNNQSGGGSTVGNVDNQGGKTTLQWATDPDFKGEVWNRLQKVLYKNGLSKDIEVKVLAGPTVTDNRRSQYQQWLSAGRKNPDILYVDSGWTIPFIVRDQLLNLSKELPKKVTQDVKKNYFDASVSTTQAQNGDMYAVPLFPDFPTMQYNKKYVRKAGYGESDFKKWSKNSMTWKEFSNVAQKAKSANDVKHGYTFQAKAYEGLSCCDFNEFMTSWGGAYFGNPKKNLFGPIGKRPVTVDEKQVVNSLKMVRTFIHGSQANHTLDGYKGNIAPPAVLQWSEEPSRKPFSAGDAVMHRNWPYSININGAKDQMGKDLGVMPIPYAKTEKKAQYPMTGGPVAALGGWHNAINPNSEKKEAALEVLKAMTSEEFQLKLFEELGFLPPRPKLFNSDRATKVPIMGRYMEPLKVAGQNAISRPVTAIWPQESQKIFQQVNGALAKSGNPKKAMTQLKSQLQAIEKSA
ncbi:MULTISPECIES: extracellular solute-binding protein [Halorussus]|uniref:extracellular solute-binding protein n=1 Tax=Halorussus TaxID=1070314 RepID=UPI00209D2A56|nr:extracellular solute-binding protein [Halorussus vallis]USZ76466.1 extracellular solute-binding protein [Halorussus vallis]